MFTGLVEETGRVAKVTRGSGGGALEIAADGMSTSLAEGGSVSVSGVCLTATELSKSGFAADMAPETLGRTSLARVRVGDTVNLERALEAGAPLGGHIVTGHVDAVGRLVSRKRKGVAEILTIEFPETLNGEIVARGSIAVDGVSLTVTEVNRGRFEVSIVPHTAERTTLGTIRPGQRVNLETDIIAKYVRGMLDAHGRRADHVARGIGVE